MTQVSITVITVVYNAANLIERTLRSVAEQNWNSVNHLIVDGGSTDGTLQVIREFSSPRITLHTGPDKGIYDAMNKGLERAVGDYVIFINAGDEFADNEVLSNLMQKCQNSDVYYGDTLIVDSNRNVTGRRRHRPPKQLTWKSFRMGMLVSHQSILARRSICPRYNLDYRISSDIDWTIRLMKRAESICYFEKPVSLFLAGGESTKRKRLGLIERWKLSTLHYGFVITSFAHLAIAFRALYYAVNSMFMRPEDFRKT
jgi:glycosyltransferase involved in cell wall biosynthesis